MKVDILRNQIDLELVKGEITDVEDFNDNNENEKNDDRDK